MFLDEIWKVGFVIFNILLMVVNEKIFKNGSDIECVLMCFLVMVFNEFLDEDSGFEVFYDCMLV